jgi:hypothetical protein
MELQLIVKSDYDYVLFTEWFGVMFIHEGLYQGAVLRFTFHIPENYLDCGDTYPVIESQSLSLNEPSLS